MQTVKRFYPNVRRVNLYNLWNWSQTEMGKWINRGKSLGIRVLAFITWCQFHIQNILATYTQILYIVVKYNIYIFNFIHIYICRLLFKDISNCALFFTFYYDDAYVHRNRISRKWICETTVDKFSEKVWSVIVALVATFIKFWHKLIIVYF